MSKWAKLDLPLESQISSVLFWKSSWRACVSCFEATGWSTVFPSFSKTTTLMNLVFACHHMHNQTATQNKPRNQKQHFAQSADYCKGRRTSDTTTKEVNRKANATCFYIHNQPNPTCTYVLMWNKTPLTTTKRKPKHKHNKKQKPKQTPTCAPHKTDALTQNKLVRRVGFEPTNPCGIGASGLRLWPCWATSANMFLQFAGYVAEYRNMQDIKRLYFAFHPNSNSIYPIL